MKLRRTTAVLMLFFSLAAPASAAGGDPTECFFTIKEVKIRSIDGDWVTVFKGSKEFDAFSEDAGITVGNKEGLVPPNRYDNVKIALSETIRVSGHDGKNKTKAGGSVEIGCAAADSSGIDTAEITAIRVSAPVWTEADGEDGLITEKIDCDYQDRDEITEIVSTRPFRKPLTVKKNSTIRVGLSIDVRGRMFFAWSNFFNGIESPEVMYFLPPREVSEVSLKVDGVSVLATKETLEWSF